MAAGRRLAAIMFTDIVGYTTLTQENEQHALALLGVHNRLLRPIFLRFLGREIKTIGDSFLVEFESALDAVTCAVEIQRVLADYNSSSPEPDRFLVRIGVHLGDVVHAEEDVLGDAINLASRIEPLAEPGGICVSEQVFAQVRNKIPNSLTKLPFVHLKNVRFPLEVYKVDLPWETGTQGGAAPPRATARRLAVLPLANMSPNPEDEFFADGLTEEIISELCSVPGLRVIARTSVMRFRGASKGVSEIGKELRVGTILEGSVRRAGNRIRITAQLVDAGTEEHLWSGKYDRELVDIFAIQSEIAKEVAVALNVALPPTPSVTPRPAPSLGAFRAYVRGRHLWNRRSDEHIWAAIRSFEEAIHFDPGYAEAYSGISDCYSILVDWGAMDPREGAPKARAAARKAVELDESIAEAHASLGLAYTRVYQWAEAEREFKRAIELNPMYASAHQWYYMNLLCFGRREEAAGELARAEEADPLSSIILFHQGYLAWVTGQDELALSNWNRVMELGDDVRDINFHKLVFFASRGRRTEALELLPRVNPGRWSWFGEALLPIAHALLGQREQASLELESLLAVAQERYVPAYRIAWVYAALGNSDKFFEWLMRSADEMGNIPYYFVSAPIFESLRKDLRFGDYLRRCALTG